MGLKSKTIQGFGWSFADNAINQGLRFVVGLILARLVSPYDYGLIGIGVIFAYIFDSVVDGGFSNALIQKKEPSEKDYSTAFLTNMMVSIVIYLIIFFLSPFITAFFNNEPLITPLIRVLSLMLVIDAMMLVPRARLTKAMDFKILTKVSLFSSAMAGITGISMALYGLGVWALVGQQLTRHFLNTALLWIVNWGNNVTLGFSASSFKSLFAFGSKLFITDFFNSVYSQLYQVVIGKFYSPATLGQFTRATQFCEVFSVTFSQMVQKVSFPALASIQDEADKLAKGFRTVFQYAVFIDFICMLSLAAVAKPMILLLVGSQWLPAVPYLQILCFSMMLYPLQTINLNILKVKGRSDLFLKIGIINKCIGIIPVILGIFFNIYWMLVGSVFTELIAYYLICRYSGKQTGYSFSLQMKDVSPSFFIALAVSLILYVMTFTGLSEYILFPIQLVAGAVLVIALSELFRIESYFGIKDILLSYYNHYRQR